MEKTDDGDRTRRQDARPSASGDMVVVLNGESRTLAAGLTVRRLLAEVLRWPERSVAVELNRRLLRTEAYDTTLKDQDVVEIVTFVGGG